MDSIPSPVANRSGEKDHHSSSKCGISCRYSMALLGCFGFSIVYALRVNLSVALVGMVNATDSTSKLHNSENTMLGASQKGKEFRWNEETQGVILSSFFYGYLFTQIPGGWMASRFGGKHVFGLGVLLTAVFTFLTPWAAEKSVGAFVAVRVLEGIAGGVTFPAMNVLLSSWSPPDEKSIMATIAVSGCNMGIIVAQLSAGALCESSFLGGWPSVFYIFGVLGILWYFSWLFLVYEKPASHPRISEQEKQYILSSIGSSQDQLVKRHRVPWLAMLKSSPLYAFLITSFCTSWSYYTILTALPTYFKQVLGFKILADGAISSIPYAGALVFSNIVAWFADRLIAKKICSVNEVRKLATVGGIVIPACLLVATSYVGKDGKVLAIVLISLAVTAGSITVAGSSVNQLDIAPRFAGIIMGIGNTFSTMSGIISPLVTGWLTDNEPTRRQWQKVFYTTATISFVGAVVFVIFGSGKEQPWNSSDEDLLEEVDVEREIRKPIVDSSQPSRQYQSINRV